MSEQQSRPTPNDMPRTRGGATISESAPDSETSRKDHRRTRAQQRPVSHTPTPETTSPLSSEELWARNYLNKHVDLFGTTAETDLDEEAESSPALQGLIDTRIKLAEESVKTRRGNLVFNKDRRASKFEQAEEAYLTARQAHLQEVLEALPQKANLAQKSALIAELNAREDGALMGEEANFYLSKEDTGLQRAFERFKGASKSKKIAIGLGAAALIGAGGFVLAGAVGAGAAAGAVVGGRVGRSYLTREASRDSTVHTLAEKQLNATLRTSNEAENISNYTSLKSILRQRKDILDKAAAITKDRVESRNGEYAVALETAEQEKNAKRKSLAWAVGGVAVGGVVGATAGAALEYFEGWRGITRGGFESDVDHTPSDIEAELEEQVNDAQDRIDTLTEENQELKAEIEALEEENEALREQLEDAGIEPDTTPSVDVEPEPAISERSQYLYGEFAGQNVNITIPEGSNIWDQLEAAVEEQNPRISEQEKQRLVGNMLNVMEREYPMRDLNLVHPGEQFGFALPAKA